MVDIRQRFEKKDQLPPATRNRRDSKIIRNTGFDFNELYVQPLEGCGVARIVQKRVHSWFHLVHDRRERLRAIRRRYL